MFEYVLYRIHYDYRKNKWINDGDIGIFEKLDNALKAQELDKVLFDNKYMYYIEHRIKLDYDNGRN